MGFLSDVTDAIGLTDVEGAIDAAQGAAGALTAAGEQAIGTVTGAQEKYADPYFQRGLGGLGRAEDLILGRRSAPTAYEQQLLDESLKRAQEMGLQIKLEVHDDNKRAQLLYKNAGFKYLGDFRIYIRRDTELFQY